VILGKQKHPGSVNRQLLLCKLNLTKGKHLHFSYNLKVFPQTKLMDVTNITRIA
jgi:hypothetical protein